MATSWLERHLGHENVFSGVAWIDNRGSGEGMATDYDAPRKTDEELSEDSLEELQGRVKTASGGVDEDETEIAESLELPGADLSNEALTVQVVPKQEDEFTCSVCFLVHHRSQLASDKGGVYVCTECAG
jgi:hypothetical protein